MQSATFGNKHILRIDKGEEIVATLLGYAATKMIRLGTVTAIGATDDVTIGLFDTKTKEYHKTDLKGDFEIVPIAGNITEMDGKPYLHLHANLCDAEHHAYGGHLNRAVVSATCELVIEEIDGAVGRKFSQDVGLNLLEFS